MVTVTSKKKKNFPKAVVRWLDGAWGPGADFSRAFLEPDVRLRGVLSDNLRSSKLEGAVHYPTASQALGG